MTISHIPTPYDINGFNLAQIIKIKDGPDAKGQHYVDGRHSIIIANIGSDDMPWEERHALTNFVHRACNSHDELINTLEQLKKYTLLFVNPATDKIASAMMDCVEITLTKAKG